MGQKSGNGNKTDKNYSDTVKQYNGDILLVGISYDKKTKKHECVIEKYPLDK